MALSDAVASAVAHWSLGEASGTRTDSVGSNDLTDNNTVGVGTGMFGNAADFERDSSEFLHVADNAAIPNGDVTFMIRCWVKLETTGGIQGIVSKWDDAAGKPGWDLFYFGAGGGFNFWVRNSANTATVGVTASMGAASDGVWYLIHAWHDATSNQIGIAVNAGTADTTSHSDGIRDTDADLTVGVTNQFAGHFDGLIDDVVILSDYILDADERDEDYNAGIGKRFEHWDQRGLDIAKQYTVAHWALDETSGTRVDSVGSNDLTDNNSVGVGTGKFGNAADFENADGEYLSIADNDDVSLGSDTSFTLSFWVNPESNASNRAVIDKRSSGGAGIEYSVAGSDINGNALMFRVGNGSSFQTVYSADGSVSTGSWHLVVVSHDGAADQLQISIDGGAKVTASWSGGTQNAAGALGIGEYPLLAPSGLTWDGLLDDVVFLKGYVLDDDEIDELYNSGTGVAFEDWDAGAPAVIHPSARFIISGGNLTRFGILAGGRL